MSGFGYGGKLRGGRGGAGMCFVKSAEILNPDPPPGLVDKQAKSDLYPQPPSSISNDPEMDNSSDKHLGIPVHRGMQQFVKSRTNYSSVNPGIRVRGHRGGYQMPGTVNLNNDLPRGSFRPVAPAQPLVSKEEYLTAWKREKDPVLAKFRKLAYEVVNLKTARPNGTDKLHSAANRVPINIEFHCEPVPGANRTNSFVCYVLMDSISVATGYGLRIKGSKANAYELALQKVFMPHFRVVQVSPTSRELQAAYSPFVSPPPQPSMVPTSSVPSTFVANSSQQRKERPFQYTESNMEAAGLRRRWNEFKPLEDFVIVEPLIPFPSYTPVHTLSRSADFNHMLIEYEFSFQGMPRCVLKIENQVLADVSGPSKIAVKHMAAVEGLNRLKRICWGIKTKNNNGSGTKINKDDMLNELNDQTAISQDNIGNKLLRKMGWSGGGMGKDGSGIAEPVSLNSVLNREGFGLSATQGITGDFKRKIREVIENYAASDNQEDLLFSCDFMLDERKIIHNECLRLHLRSKSRGKGDNRYLCVSRKRSANQLFDHIMSCGGETAKYKLVPPGSDTDVMSCCDQDTNDCDVGDGQECYMDDPIPGPVVGHLTPLMSGPKPLMGGPNFVGSESTSRSRDMNKFNSDSAFPASSHQMGSERWGHARPDHYAREHVCRDSNVLMGYSQDWRNESNVINDREILDRPRGRGIPIADVSQEMYINKRRGKWVNQRTQWGQSGNSSFPYNKFQPK
ncbi:unnamed protein product [Lymnaea stagnalis]|uniref:Uncharacterized protein n=1 Tax=Lymnaea stagnalis TaxID=6523 RepID=A0AAV2IFA0_LYMST